MITHIVLLQPKAEITEEEMMLALHHVQELQQAIPGIVDIKIGKNCSNHNQGYSYGLVMRFTDAQHLYAYALHPAHQVVRQELQRIDQNIIDFGSPSG